jgi:glutathione peroxidase
MKYFITLFMVMIMFGFSKARADVPHDVYGFSFTSIIGDVVPLSDYRGKVVLIVNTASKCGFTKQYEGLQKLYEEYADRGFLVIGVPANNFGGQEPGSNQDIKEFCEGVYQITFPMMEKIDVVGKDAHPFYQWAAAQKKGGLLFSTPRWNFHKYLIGPDGALAGSFGSQVAPESADLRHAIENLLK